MRILFWKKRNSKIPVAKLGDRRLKLTLRGINEFEQVTGVNILEAGDIRDLSPKEIYALVWACLIWEDKNLKLDDIPVLIEQADMAVLLKSLLDCINNSLPEAKPETSPLASQNPSNSTG